MGLGVSKYIGSIEINVFHILHFSIWFGSVSQGMYKNKVNFDNFFKILTLLFYELESWKILFQRTIEVIQFSQSQFLLAHWLQNDLESSNFTMDAIFSPEPLLDFCMHYMRDYCASPHFHRFLLLYLAKIGENGG